MRYLLRTALAVVAVVLAACASQQTLEISDIRPLYDSTGNLKRVDGIRQALESSATDPVRVLVAHGMIAHEPGYSTEFQTEIAKRLNLQQGPDSGQVELQRGYEFTPSFGPAPIDGVSRLLLSQLRRTAWGMTGQDGRFTERLVFYELLWAPLRDEVKNTFVGCFERSQMGKAPWCQASSTSRPNPDRRVAVNKALKETITLGGFADAMLVLGPIGDVIRDDLTVALCVIAEDFLQPSGNALANAAQRRCQGVDVLRASGSEQRAMAKLQASKFFAITHSLGSFFFVDAQQAFTQARGLPPDNKDAPPVCVRKSPLSSDEQLLGNMLFVMTDQATVFMNANQISLLSLARVSSASCRSADERSCPNPYLRERSAACEPWDQAMGMPPMSIYVAFNDTNDLLGFELPPFMAGIDGSRYVNVSVRNPGFTVPGLFKNPSAAHTQQARNPAIVKAIVEGFEIP